MLACSRSHARVIHCGAIQMRALLPFVFSSFSIVAVLGNCKQYQHSPEKKMKLPQSHALLKALRLAQKLTAFFYCFSFFFFQLVTCCEMFMLRIGMSRDRICHHLIHPFRITWHSVLEIASDPVSVENKCAIVVFVFDRFYCAGIKGLIHGCFYR